MFYLQAPRPPKTTFYYVRGTLGSVKLDSIKSGGWSTRTADKREADRIRSTWEREAQKGFYPDGRHFTDIGKPVEAEPVVVELTLAQAIEKAYGQPEQRDAWVNKLVDREGHRIAREITQEIVEEIAAVMYPGAKPATTKRQVYTPIKRALKVAKVATHIELPEGHDDYRHGNFLQQGDELHKVLDAIDTLDPEYGLLCELLAYSPTRRGEIMNLRVFRLDLNTRSIYLPGIGKDNRTKTGEARTIALTDRLFARLSAHVRGKQADDYVFRFRSTGGAFYKRLHKALQAAGVHGRLDERHRGFHLLRHTYATGMRQLGVDLVETGGWATASAAKRYDHHVSQAARRVAELPSRPVVQLVGNSTKSA